MEVGGTGEVGAANAVVFSLVIVEEHIRGTLLFPLNLMAYIIIILSLLEVKILSGLNKSWNCFRSKALPSIQEIFQKPVRFGEKKTKTIVFRGGVKIKIVKKRPG